MTAREPRVRFRDVHVVFPVARRRPVHALRGVNLEVEAGSVTGLLGPNGCGKTTALSCILGLLSPQCGEVLLDGEPVGTRTFEPAERPFGVLLEDTRLPPFLSVAEALATVALLRGYERAPARTEVDRVVAFCGVDDLVDQRVGVLSKGQARKVGLAAALVGDPKLLILDEPSAGLDVSARVEFEALLRTLHDDARTVLVASHFLGDVQNTCSHVCIMREGRVLAHGPTTELISARPSAQQHNAVYIAAEQAAAATDSGLAIRPTHHVGLVEVMADLDDEALLRRLLDLGIVPRRIEPRESLLALYLDLTESQEVV